MSGDVSFDGGEYYGGGEPSGWGETPHQRRTNVDEAMRVSRERQLRENWLRMEAEQKALMKERADRVEKNWVATSRPPGVPDTSDYSSSRQYYSGRQAEQQLLEQMERERVREIRGRRAREEEMFRRDWGEHTPPPYWGEHTPPPYGSVSPHAYPGYDSDVPMGEGRKTIYYPYGGGCKGRGRH